MAASIRHDWDLAEIEALLELPLVDLLWQLAYAEIHVTDVLWPDFNADALKAALLDFQRRHRRFGGLDPIRP